MVDLSMTLGRPVPTVRQILEVIRPQLRMAAVTGPTINAAYLSDTFVGEGQDEEPMLGSDDEAASEAMFDALRESALRSIADWVGDMAVDPCPQYNGMVYDKARVTVVIGDALNECWNGEPSEAVLDVLDLDEGVCESIGHVLRALAIPIGSDELPVAKQLMAASTRYLDRA